MGTSRKGQPLSELRKAGTVEENANSYNLRSWLQSAKHCAELAQEAEGNGAKEDAYVGYLRALGIYQLCLAHRDYPAVQSEGAKHPLWQPMNEFKSHRNEYVDKAKKLAEELKHRDVERGEANGSTPAAAATAPSVPAPAAPASDQPDVSSGGSIAARMAALRGAGLNASSGNKRLSRDASAEAGPSDSRSRNGAVASTAGPPPVAPAAGPSSRRGSAASINTGIAGQVGPPPAPSSGLASPYTPGMRLAGLEDNRTGSSFASIRSDRGSGQDKAVNGNQRDGSAPSTPVLTPNPSGNKYESAQAGPSSQSSTSRYQTFDSGPANPPPSVPNVSSHFHKASLPNMPTPGQAHSYDPPTSRSNGYATPSGVRGPRSRENSVGTPEVKPANQASSSSATNLPANDDLAQFTSAFPSLTDFENLPEFASPPPPEPKRYSGGTSRFDTIQETSEQEDQDSGMPKFPSPPRNAPGSLGVSGIPPRPRSLPEPDTANGTTIGGEPVEGAYFPKSPLESAGDIDAPLVSSPVDQSVRGLTRDMDKLGSGPPPAKPSFPFAITVSPRRLREYMQNPAVRLLLLDVRSKEDYDRGAIGRAPDSPSAATCDIVWLDPTLLDRTNMDAVKLENALSVSPSQEQRAFKKRKEYDLVIIYDEISQDLPRKGEKPNAVSRLYNMLYVDVSQSDKFLVRSPVLLIGGYRGWQTVPTRSSSGSFSSGPLTPIYGQNGISGKSRPPVPSKKPSLYQTDTGGSDSSSYKPSGPYATNLAHSFYGGLPQSMSGVQSGYTGRPLPTISHKSGQSTSSYHSPPNGSPSGPTPPPAAATHPGVSRRRSDYVEHQNQAYTGYALPSSPSRRSLEYPSVDGPGIPQPPPAAATPQHDRQDLRPRQHRSASVMSYEGLTNVSSDEVAYWNDVAVGMSGLKNLGNTCYMNSTLQCLSATYPLARFFLDGSFKRAVNTTNPMGTKGDLAKAFATLISMLWKESYTFLSPVTFRKSISTWAPSFAGSDQQDSQEFLSFLLDGLHEDLNRIRTRPPPVEMTPEREAELEVLPPAVAADKEWKIYKMRNDSLIVDLFQGQYRSRMECLTCHKTSTTYDAFMYLSLPVPSGKSKVVLQQLVDNFIEIEVMEKAEAWNCPRCKVPRKATKSLSIARLPPVLLIHLKRFSTKNGVFWDKSETPVIFPVKGLDLTRYLPPSDPSLASHTSKDDPRSTQGPFKYDLFAVSNHMGSLSSGHYTAFVHSSKGWLYCDDSKISPASERDVVAKPAYILFYKRVQT